MQYTFVVLHAPCQVNATADDPDPQSRIAQWWVDSAELVQQHVSTSMTWLFVGANAPLAADGSEAI